MADYDSGIKKRIQLEINDFVKLELIGHVTLEPYSICNFHKHPFWELIYIREGLGVHQIAGTSVTVNKGDLCLIPPNTIHCTTNENPFEHSELYIGFSSNYRFREEEKNNVQYILKNITEHEEIREHLLKICDMFEYADHDRDKGSTEHDSILQLPMEKLVFVLTRIISHISTHRVLTQNLQDIRNQNTVDKVKSYLEVNLCRNIKLEELGSMLYLSSHYIGDTFKKVTGSSIKEYHNMLRMQYAYQLLRETELSISDISEQLGFDNIHYFSKRFKDRYTFPPSHLRKK